MKPTIALKGLLLAAITAVSAGAQTPINITVTNPAAITRTDELVVLSRAFLQQKLGVLATGKYIQVKYSNTPQVVQFDDLDGDGVWDEACLLHTFLPSEKVVFAVVASDDPAAIKVRVRAHTRQMHKLPDNSFGPSVVKDTMPYNNPPTDFSKQKLPPYLTEGPGWENDKVGFRKYFDTRNANDLWGKVTRNMVLDEVGVHPEVIYHNFNPDWGMDILKVGGSLGAGGLALQFRDNGKDTLVRFGRNVGRTIYTELANGPVRAMFTLQYQGWKIGNNKPIDVEEQISIWGGQYFFENKVTIKEAPVDARLVTGLNDFFVAQADTLRTPIPVLYTYGIQSENKDNLGMAILVPAQHFAGYGKTPDANTDVSNTFTIAQHVTNNHLLSYRFMACWEKSDPQFATKKGFEAFLQNEAFKAAKPLEIK